MNTYNINLSAEILNSLTFKLSNPPPPPKKKKKIIIKNNNRKTEKLRSG